MPSRPPAKSPITGVGIRRGGAQFEAISRSLAQQAALELAESGYQDFAPASVAERAGVSTRTAFRHYATKLDLALSGIRSLPTYAGWLDEQVPGELMADRLRRGLRIGAEHPELLAPILATCIAHRLTQPELLKELSTHVLEPRRRAIEAFLTEGQARGELRPEVRSSAMAAADVGVFTVSAIGQLPLGRGQRRVDRIFENLWPLIATDAHLAD